MFGLFKKQTEAEKLQTVYEKMLSEAHRLSTIDRKASDVKMAEAEAIMDKILALKK